MKPTTLLLSISALMLAAATAATTVYLDDGTAVETEDDVYTSSEPLYRVTGNATVGYTFTPVEPLSPSDPLTDPCTGLTFGGLPEGCVTPPEPEPEPDCDGFTFGGLGC